MASVAILALGGLLLRLVFVVYGEWQDATMAVKFTDIDYHVFTDAARYMTQGKSPYLRDTYRYTPLLAWILQWNIWLTPIFGKLLFIVLDVLSGYLIYKLVHRMKKCASMASVCASAWLFNPLPMTVSARGNAESIMSALVLLCILLLRTNKIALAGVIYALAIHVKIYPVTYAVPIFLYLGCTQVESKRNRNISTYIASLLWPTKDRLKFISAAAVTLGFLTTVYYIWYGWDFLYHTYLYHVTRKDIRHNFSVYFYMLYLQTSAEHSLVLGLLAFIPQVALLLVFSFTYYRELELVFFLNTMAFVTFNKVCTSQYFLWYLCLLPLLVPRLRSISLTKAIGTAALWFGGQGVWLLPAYYLEFEGRNTFIYIWAAGIAFFCINCYVMSVIPQKTEHKSGVWLLPAYYLEFEGRNTFIYIWAAGIAFFCINCYVMSAIPQKTEHKSGVWLLPAYYLEFEGRNTFIYIWAAGIAFFCINCYVMSVIQCNYQSSSTDPDPWNKPSSDDSVGEITPKSVEETTPDSVGEISPRVTRSQTRQRNNRTS